MSSSQISLQPTHFDELNLRLSRLESVIEDVSRHSKASTESIADHYKKIEVNFRNVNDLKSKFEEESYKNRDVFTRIDQVERADAANSLRTQSQIEDLKI